MQVPERGTVGTKLVVAQGAGLKRFLYPAHIDWIRGGQNEAGPSTTRRIFIHYQSNRAH